MRDDTVSPERKLWRTIRNRLVAGMLALVPLAVTLIAMRLVLGWMMGLFKPFVEKASLLLTSALGMEHVRPELLRAIVTVASIAGFLLLLYVTGSLAQAVFGRRLIRAGETLLMKVPLAGSIYSAARQVIEAVTLPTQSALSTVVLVEFPRRGAWSVGFLTGPLHQAYADGMLKVFVPTTPNPTTGFFLILPAADVLKTAMSVEDAFKMIISGGIVSPADMSTLLSSPGHPDTNSQFSSGGHKPVADTNREIGG